MVNFKIFSGQNEDIHAHIHIKDCNIIDSSYAAISYIEGKVFGPVFENIHINGTGTYVLQIQTSGDAVFKNVHAYNVQAKIPIFNCGIPFNLTVEGNKDGWYTDKPECTDIQKLTPKYPW